MAHVLLIEPDTALSRVYRQALEHAGHTAATARGAQQALSRAEEQTPDVVVLELQLAAHNGVEFLHEFRSYGEWQEVPVIVNTHIPAQSLASVAGALQTDLGVAACLYKPRTSLAQLISSVNEQVRAQGTIRNFDREGDASQEIGLRS